MKNLPKIFIMAALFSFPAVFHVSAEEIKTAPVITVSEGVTVALPDGAGTPAVKTTLADLEASFNGERNAHARYIAFAKRADAEGYGKVASLFRAAAKAEQVHLQQHAKEIRALKGIPSAIIETPVVKSTKENLKTAVKGFENAAAAETVHASLYKQALENLDAWKGRNKEFYVCPVCGNVTEKVSFKSCPICGVSGKRFVAVG